MAKIHTLTYNGTKSSDLGVFVTGSGSFDAAEFDVDKYEIPGRNGDLILSNNRYKNIEITYPAFIPKAFMDKVQNVRNWLRSSRVYARLEDTYDMDHYRLGIPTGEQSFSPENRNDGANFEMTFDCKPQRFLKVGETPETVEADVQTESGEIVTFETVAESPITSASVSLSPIQSLNGYDSPWPAGGGKNLIPSFIKQDTTGAGLTLTLNDDGSVKIAGTANNNASVIIGQRGVSIPLPAGTYTFFNGISDSSNKVYCQAVSADHVWFSRYARDTFTLTQATTITRLDIGINAANGESVNVVVKPQLEKGSTATTFSPYSNICPISGHTGAELIRTGKNLYSREGSEYNVPVFGTDGSSASYPDVAVWWFRVKPNTTYYLSFVTPSVPFYFRWINCDSEKGFISRPGGTYSSANLPSWITTPYNALWVQIAVNQYPQQSISQNDWKICISETATSYEPYQGETYSVTFTDQGTVYGGTYDFVSGKLRMTHKAVTFDGTQTVGLANWETSAGDVTSAWLYRRSLFPDIKVPTDPTVNIICDRLRPLPYSAGYGGVYGHENSGICTVPGSENNWSFAMRIPVEGITTATQINAWLANNPVTVVYELATPLEYTLSAQQLTTLLGQNVVWGSGPITLTYAEPYNVENPTLFDARPLFTVTNPAEGDVIMVNGQAITFVDGYTGTVFIDCETMNAFSGAANLNSIIQATDFPVLVPGTNIITWTGAGECTMAPRWWEL